MHFKYAAQTVMDFRVREVMESELGIKDLWHSRHRYL